ncbi:MAG: TolC family protein [Prolixibacteraceae bacterium]|jgi:outer membrane protein|nr:TolC family protein [Prolixibacteraceae bacterium]
MKKIILYLLVGILSGLTVTAQQTSDDILKLSLEDCIKLTLNNNYNRQSVALNELANQEIYEQSKMERLPNFNASIGETYTHSNTTGSDWSGNYSLNTGVTIYQGGYINDVIEKSRLSTEQSKYRTVQYENDLTIQVLQSFLTALGNEELLRYQNAVLKASEEQVRQGKVRFEAGEILESDYLLLQAQYETDLNNKIETTISRDNSLNTLKNLMSLDLSQDIEIIYPDDSVLDEMGIMPSEAEVVSRSIKTLPDLQISDYNVEIAEAGVRISRSGYYPTLSLDAGIGTGHMNDFSKYGSQLSDGLNEQIGLTLSIPIFNNNRTKSNITQSRIALQQAELEREQTELDVRQTIIQEYRNVVLAESKYKSSQIRQNAYLASFQAYQMKFEQGSITAVELLQQQNNYINIMNDYVQSKFGFMLKRKVLDVYMGNPVTL